MSAAVRPLPLPGRRSRPVVGLGTSSVAFVARNRLARSRDRANAIITFGALAFAATTVAVAILRFVRIALVERSSGTRPQDARPTETRDG
jgi:hypothetical protein